MQAISRQVGDGYLLVSRRSPARKPSSDIFVRTAFFFWRKSSSGSTAYTHFLKLFYASLHHPWLACLSFFASSVCSTLERIVLKSFFFFLSCNGEIIDTALTRHTWLACWRTMLLLEGPGQETRVIWSYSRAAGCTVSVAGVPFAPLQVNEL